MGKLLTIKQASRRSPYSYGTLRQYVNRGLIGTRRDMQGRHWIDLDDLKAFARRKRWVGNRRARPEQAERMRGNEYWKLRKKRNKRATKPATAPAPPVNLPEKGAVPHPLD